MPIGICCAFVISTLLQTVEPETMTTVNSLANNPPSPDMVLIERHGQRADVVLNRPDKRNALIVPMMAQLRDAFLQLAQDDSVNAILVRGAGGALCSGLDLKTIQADPPPAWVPDLPRVWQEANVAMAACPKPMVCALEKYAINGGAPIAFASDFIVAGQTAYILVGEVQRGMAAPNNLAWLQGKYGEAIALRFALLGDPVAAPDLLRLGIAHSVVPDDQVLAQATALADKLASFPGATSQGIKRAIRGLGHSGLNDPKAWFARALHTSQT